MKFVLPLLVAAMLAAGCASKKASPPLTPVNNPPRAIVTPDTSLTAKVALYDSGGRYVVLSFPIGQMAKMNQTMFLYREGLKVGEVKVTGPQNDNNVVADLVSGDAQAGDDARDQ